MKVVLREKCTGLSTYIKIFEICQMKTIIMNPRLWSKNNPNLKAYIGKIIKARGEINEI